MIKLIKDKPAMPASADYAPYDRLDAFWRGYKDYGLTWTCPYGGDVDGQAWDRGMEYASRLRRYHGK